MNIKKMSIIGVILSLLSIIPIAFMCINMNNLFNLQHIGAVDPKVAEQLLSRTLTSPMYLGPIIVGLVIYSLSAVVAAFMIKRKATGLLKWEASLLLVFGGFGVASIFGIIWLIRNKAIRKIKALKKVSIIGAGALVVIPVPLITIAAVYEGFDARTFASPIVYSSDESTPNLIEIFTDGFDEAHIRPILNRYTENDNHDGSKNFGDFTSFPFSVAQGFLTNMSVPTLWGGDEFNPFVQRQRKEAAVYKSTVLNYTYENLFTEAVVKHMHDIKPDQFNKLNVLNTTGMSDESGYSMSLSGDEEDVRKTYAETYQLPDASDLNIVNWGEAKHSVSGDFGINQYNHDAVFYKWIEKNGKTPDTVKQPTAKVKGTRILIQDLITHTPFTADIDGKLEWDSNANKYERVVRTLNHYFHSLPEGVYDNSMIVIYGDHADHSRKIFEDDKETILRGNRTFSMVKYPNRSSTKMQTHYKENLNVAMYVPYIRQLAIHYFNNNDFTLNQDEMSWINSNPHYSLNQQFPVYGSGYETMWKAKFDPNITKYMKPEGQAHAVDDRNLVIQSTHKYEEYNDLNGKNTYNSGMGWT